uniref:SPATA31 domain-containing protein n=1 Tax=Otolemur garnettii TaxID=30611 RepID=H0XNF4_OTOGA
MDTIVHILSTQAEQWLSCGLAVLDVYPQLAFLGGLGLLLFYMWYRMMKSYLAFTWENKEIHKRIANRRRKLGKSRGKALSIRPSLCKEAERKACSRFLSCSVCPILCSPWGEDCDTITFQQLFQPKHLCDIYSSKPKEIVKMQLLKCLEDTTDISVSSSDSEYSHTDSSYTLGSTLIESSFGNLMPAPPPDPSPPPPPPPPPPSTISANLMAPLPNSLSPPSLDDSLPPEPAPLLHSKFPMDSSGVQILTIPSSPPHHTQEADTDLSTATSLSIKTIFTFKPKFIQDVDTLSNLSQTMDSTDPYGQHHISPPSASPAPDNSTVIPSTSIPLLSNLVLGLPSPDGADSLPYVPIIRGTDRSIFSTSEFFLWLAHTKHLFPSNLSPCDSRQELHVPHPSVTSFVGESAATVIECGNLSLPSPDSMALLEKNIKRKSDLLLLNRKENKIDSFLEQRRSDYPPNLPANMSASTSDEHDSAVPLPLCTHKDRAKELHLHQQPLHSKTLEVTQGQSQTQLQSPLQIPPPEPLSEMRFCGVCVHKPQNEAQCLIPSEICHVEWNVLQKQQEAQWGLPSVVKKCQADLSPTPPKLSMVNQSSKAHVSFSILLGDFPLSSELRKKLEHHLQKRLIQHRWGLPRRVLESVSLLNPWRGSPETSESKHHYRLSSYKSQSGEDPESFGLSHSRSSQGRRSETFLPKKDVRKDQGHSLKNGIKDDLLSDPERYSYKGLASNMVSVSGSYSRGSSVCLAQKKQFENGQRIQMSKKFEEVNECHISKTVHNSQYPTICLPEKSHSQIKHCNLVTLMGEDTQQSTSQEVCILGPSLKEKLEDHIKTFHQRMILTLPL